jgi:hypothetical protein
MAVYFVFSDEVGDYHTSPTAKFLRANPYFIRVGILVGGEDWPVLRDAYNKLSLPVDCELKWAHIGSVIAHRKRGENIPKNREYSPLNHYSDEELVSFVENTVALLKQCTFCRIIYTITDNNRERGYAREDIYQWHIQNLMQRTEYELQNIGGLATMFLDSSDNATNAIVRNAYAEIYQDGDFVKKYLRIVDSLSFALSNQSFGIRFADYVVGIFNNFIRGYQTSTTLFRSQVWPLVRKSPTGSPLGWGICQVPSDNITRGNLQERLAASGLQPEIRVKDTLF